MPSLYRNSLNRNFEEIYQYLNNTECFVEYLVKLNDKLNGKQKTIKDLGNNIESMINANNVAI